MPETAARTLRSEKARTLAVAAWIFLTVLTPASADPVGDFFKKIGRSMSHANQKSPARTPDRRAKNINPSRRPAPVNPAASPSVIQPPEVAASVAPSPTPAPTIARAATINPEAHASTRDVPYAIPVPNKPGFVTSPYAPNQGLVDVRGFRSGTEVKDPYTGKFFLTP